MEQVLLNPVQRAMIAFGNAMEAHKDNTGGRLVMDYNLPKTDDWAGDEDSVDAVVNFAHDVEAISNIGIDITVVGDKLRLSADKVKDDQLSHSHASDASEDEVLLHEDCSDVVYTDSEIIV